MDVISPVYLLLAAIICSMVARAMLIRAAFSISKGWGFTVLFVPLGPLFFRWNYKELAHEGQHWRTATTVCAVAFFAITGSTGSTDDLWEVVPKSMRPAEVAEHQEPETEGPEVEDPEETDEPVEGAVPSAGAATPAVTSFSPAQAASANPVASIPPAAADPVKKGFMARIVALVVPSAEPPPPTQPTAVPATPIGPTLSERVAANQQEFARLGKVYENLKRERGYLKKADQESIKAYNAEAAQYQAALAAARAEQMEINKQVLTAKK